MPSLLDGKWKIRLRELAGITDMALALCLKDFAAGGVMRRGQFCEVPPRVEHSLTEQGRSLVASLEGSRQRRRGQKDRRCPSSI